MYFGLKPHTPILVNATSHAKKIIPGMAMAGARYFHFLK
jgi:hypothetical protein